MSHDLAARTEAQPWPGIGLIARWALPDRPREWAWLPITEGATFVLTPPPELWHLRDEPRHRLGLRYRRDRTGD